MNRRKKKQTQPKIPVWRCGFLIGLFALAIVVLEGRLVYLQVIDSERLTSEGDDRQLREVEISAHRASIIDRNGEPLAVSTPVDTIYVDPTEIDVELEQLEALAAVLDIDAEGLLRSITSNQDTRFAYIKRHIPPSQAAEALALEIPGVRRLREYRRFYPDAEVAGHLIGFTDIDDKALEGLEVRFNPLLASAPGSKRVQQDLLGRVIRDVELIKAPQPGVDVRVSIDRRLQYLAYRELKKTVQESGARWGSIVLMDPETGEVLAMANQPSFNPNDRGDRDPALYRNRAITDPFEPGSAFKPLVLAAAIEADRYHADTIVDTGNGRLVINGSDVTADTRALGRVTVREIMAESSSVGMGLIGSDLDGEQIWDTLGALGIGQLSGSGMIGESHGVLSHHSNWHPTEQATLAYGYHLQATTLQLARAYSAIAAGGMLPTVTFEAIDPSEPRPERVRAISEATAAELMSILETVVADGTGSRAAIPNYRVAGKTGTAKLYERGGYSTDRYRALFAGIAPASRPRLVAVIVVEDPRGEEYYGGLISAPVFSRVVGGALRIMNVPPDDLPEDPVMSMAEAVP
jgi:cell division protein FtsI (penicillin-binding protein 3)